ncbi:hypothetical protein GLOTRDRAFT_114307 [Gloeophyllum trabeum ATCC 11539]|uniref:Uncharacterized protein n=1 Tax=Gloeophyllum trabeum (strain ATCC 11539 / FP-39264 / Madison 617) TaxID=670483 RepID=S7QJZ2_GLOTA|nr:uncharacterized protein GLOTRDRAFT_114307 [Gloeophyllum trabeum ATCC 11539]EPQ59692.1 hypothetical protein GLOTRDRAFT_114307 [Gloeophyllum trabeum ATCC 11539]
MSFSVDDLVASLKGNHIGQEALDLAALQAQLAQTLFTPQRHAEPAEYAHHCNTPTASTPSSSFTWSHMPHRRKSSVASLTTQRSMDEDITEMEEDEKMVEELLWPSSPSTSSASTSSQTSFHHAQPASAHHQTPASPAFPQRNTAPSYAYTYSAEPTSIFATQDPFYVAQMQAAQNAHAPAFFAQAGRPAAHSPFVMAQPVPVHSQFMAFDR